MGDGFVGMYKVGGYKIDIYIVYWPNFNSHKSSLKFALIISLKKFKLQVDRNLLLTNY